MRIRHVRDYAGLSLMLFASLLLLFGVAVQPANALNANSMWVEPPTISYGSSTTVGTKFNVTIWLNSSNTNSWQFYLVYSNATLNATGCGYTGSGKSLWSGALPSDTVTPAFGSHNHTRSYVLLSEVLKSSAEKNATGSLGWVEFSILVVPPSGTTITDELRLDLIGPFNSLIMDKVFTELTINYGKATYTIPEFPLPVVLITFFIVLTTAAVAYRRRLLQGAARSAKL